jgi:hypothetical protein
MLIAHKIALEPNNVQATYLTRACGTAPFAYNRVLAEGDRQYRASKLDPALPAPSEMALRRQLNTARREQFQWMLEVTQRTPQLAIRQLEWPSGTSLPDAPGTRPSGAKACTTDSVSRTISSVSTAHACALRRAATATMSLWFLKIYQIMSIIFTKCLLLLIIFHLHNFYELTVTPVHYIGKH